MPLTISEIRASLASTASIAAYLIDYAIILCISHLELRTSSIGVFGGCWRVRDSCSLRAAISLASTA